MRGSWCTCGAKYNPLFPTSLLFVSLIHNEAFKNQFVLVIKNEGVSVRSVTFPGGKIRFSPHQASKSLPNFNVVFPDNYLDPNKYIRHFIYLK